MLVEIVKGDGNRRFWRTDRPYRYRSHRLRLLLLPKQPKAAAAPAPAASRLPAAPAGVPGQPVGARKILDEKGIAAADVAGSGRGGRVTKEDAVAAAPKAGPAPARCPDDQYAALSTPVDVQGDRGPNSAFR